MFKGHFASGSFTGAGAAKNIPCGFIPAYVRVLNPRGSTETITEWFGLPVVKFDGGSIEIRVGDKLVDASAGGSFVVHSVELVSGTWEGGDAAGRLEVLEETGTITNNNDLNRIAGQDRGAAADVATLDGSVNYSDADVDSEVGTPAARFVTAYNGTAGGNSKGFTIAAGAAVSTEEIWWVAFGKE